MDWNYKLIDSAQKKCSADLVLKNVSVVDVFSQEIYTGDIAITGDAIAGTGTYEGEIELDCSGLFAVPGLIDAHVHIESSKVIPELFSRILIKNGITACIADPHEIANVLGTDGIKFMLDNSRESLIDLFYMMPSCVPAVDFEDNGAVLDGKALSEFLGARNVIGLGEVMDVPSVINMDTRMYEKLKLFKNRIIDGHCPDISTEQLNAYVSSGIVTDHECTTVTQAQEEIKRGMYVMLREGSAAKNLLNLLPAVNERNFKRFLFCTDDKDIVDLQREGSINHNIKLAVRNNMNPIQAITIASLNAAECYGLKRRGAIAPGYIADIVLVKNLEDFEIAYVIKNGKIYIENPYIPKNIYIRPSMNIDHITENILKVKAENRLVNVIKALENTIYTERVQRQALIEDGLVKGVESKDCLKIAVFERHKNTGKSFSGFIEGLGFKGCTIAQSIGHDSHNIICAGDCDSDMVTAVNRVIDIQGGIVIVSGGNIIGELALPIAGLMSFEEPSVISNKLSNMRNTLKKYETHTFSDIFITLSFMTLPVIPEIKITPRGLYDFKAGSFIGLFD